ncbi:MAG: hypothetical protein C4325_07825 [Blastocatellia bacterium]
MSNEKLKKVILQSAIVEDLARQQKQAPSAELGTKLEIEMDRLAFLNSASKRDAAERARFVIEKARLAMLGRAITQPLPPLKK